MRSQAEVELHGDVRMPLRQAPHWIQSALHELCQPLTTVEGRLYLTTLHPPDKGGKVESAEAELQRVQEGVTAALVECGRMMRMVRAMQERMELEAYGNNWNDKGAGDERYTELSSGRAADSSAIGGVGQCGRRTETKAERGTEWPALDGV